MKLTSSRLGQYVGRTAADSVPASGGGAAADRAGDGEPAADRAAGAGRRPGAAHRRTAAGDGPARRQGGWSQMGQTGEEKEQPGRRKELVWMGSRWVGAVLVVLCDTRTQGKS